MTSTPAPETGGPPAPRRPTPRDVPKRTPLVARPVGADERAAPHPTGDAEPAGEG